MMNTTTVDRVLLQNSGTSDGGPVAVLIVVCVLFCFIWTPMLCSQRCPGVFRRLFSCRLRSPPPREGEVIRLSLHSLGLLGLDDPMANSQTQPQLWNPIRGMTLEDRKAFLENVLVSKKIVKVTKQGPASEDGGDIEDCAWKENGKKTTLLLADVNDTNSTTKHISVEPCPICLTEYEEGEILCWSQNSECRHCFHKDCAIEWLLRHEECPLCRKNYLSLDGDAEQPEVEEAEPPVMASIPNPYLRSAITNGTAPEHGPEDNREVWRGVQLVYLLSRLQSLADNRPNTTIRLEGVELANGRRGNLEIQRATESSMVVGGRGLNVRVTNDVLEDTPEENEIARTVRNELSEAEMSVHLDLPEAGADSTENEQGNNSPNGESENP